MEKIPQHTYRCINAACENYHLEFLKSPLAPKEWRLATGGYLQCERCYEIVQWVRMDWVDPQAT